MNQLLEQLKNIWGNMTPASRWGVGSVLSIVIAGLVWIIASQAGTQWKTVGRGLTPEDIQSGVAALEAKNIRVRLQDNGMLQVPEENFDQARVELATQSASGGVGMELFNESTFGQSAFQEAVNYHRALEGELARTIRTIKGVESARIHLVIPKKRLFKKDQKPPTASVKLTLKPGIDLTKKQIKGIQHLVSSAIEGLKSHRVAIIDQTGSMLARPRDNGDDTHGDYYEMQARQESKLETRIVDLLEPLAGEDKVRAQVTLDMDFSQVEITEKTLDPEQQVIVSEDRTEETAQTRDPANAGVPGVASNIPGRVTAPAGSKANTRTARKESTRYDTSNSIRRTQLPVGRITRLSIAVAIDGRSTVGEDGETTWAPRTAEEMKQFKELVSKATGYDTKRGDQLAVINQRFEVSEQPAAISQPAPSPWIREGIKWGAILLVVLLLAFGVVRPLVKAATTSRQLITPEGIPITAAEYAAMSQTVAAGALPPPPSEEEEEEEEGAPSGERLRLRAVESTKDDPQRAAQVIRAWLLVEE